MLLADFRFEDCVASPKMFCKTCPERHEDEETSKHEKKGRQTMNSNHVHTNDVVMQGLCNRLNRSRLANSNWATQENRKI